MKKIFTKILLVLTLVTTGFTMSSCDEETITQLLTILQQLNQGQELYFDGSSTVTHCVFNEKNNQYEYNPSTGKAAFKSHGLNMVVRSGQAAIALGDFSMDGATLTNIDFPAVTYDNGNIGDIKDEGYVYGVKATITREGGQAQNISTPTDIDYPYAFVDGTVSSTGALKLNIQIHLSEKEYYDVIYNGVTKGNQQ